MKSSGISSSVNKQIRGFLWICLHLLRKFLTEYVVFAQCHGFRKGNIMPYLVKINANDFNNMQTTAYFIFFYRHVSSNNCFIKHSIGQSSKKQRITMIIVFTVIVSIKNLTTFTISRKVNLKQSDYQEKYLVQSPVKHLWWSLFAKVVKQLVIIFDESLYYIFFSGGENLAKQIFYEI